LKNPVDINLHLSMFARSFVLKEKIDRWEDLLIRRASKIHRKSSQIFDHLDFNYCKPCDDIAAAAKDTTSGVYYGFHWEPEVITFKEAVEKGDCQNAIFSIDPGKFCVFFFHEGLNYICKR